MVSKCCGRRQEGVDSLALNSRAIENTGHIHLQAIGPNLTAREAEQHREAQETFSGH